MEGEKMKEQREERRKGKDRRKFCYTSYSPERRLGFDRRVAPQKLIKDKVA